MSITQTYFLAHSARGKLSREAARADHDLRLLVGHANMLDNLMIDLANAEQEQERWFNKSLNSAHKEDEISHQETIAEEPEWEAESSDESDYETNDDMEVDDEEDASLSLTRTASRHSPPELTHDEDSDSDDEHMPPSPPNLTLEHFTQSAQPLFPSKKATQTDSLESDQFYLEQSQRSTLIAAY